MALRGLNPNVQAVVESMLALEAPIVEHVTPVREVEGELLDLIVEMSPNTFWILSEDEESYELLQIPISEGVGSMLGGLLKGVGGFLKRLFGDATDWISRHFKGGTARQLFHVYQKNPEAARKIMEDGLKSQFPPDQVAQQMKHFDAKMSRAMAARTNIKKLYNHVAQNPNDTAALDKLRHIGTAEAAVQKAELEAQQNGQDPQQASRGALKQALAGPMREFLGGVKDSFEGKPQGHGGRGLAGSMAHTATPQDQMLKGKNKLPGATPENEPAEPGAQPDSEPAQAGPKIGDKVWAKDPQNGKVLAGKVVDQGSMMKDPESAKAYAGKLAVLPAQGSIIPMAGKQWQVGDPPAQPEASSTQSGNVSSSASSGDQTPAAPQSTDPEDPQGQGAEPEQKPKGPTNRPSGQYPNRTEMPDAGPQNGDEVTAVVNGQQVTGKVLAPKELNGRKVVRLPGNQALSFDQFPWKKVDANAQPEQAAQTSPQSDTQQPGAQHQAEAPALNTSAPNKPDRPVQQPAQPAAQQAQVTPEAQPAQPGAEAKPGAQQAPPPKPPVRMAPAMKKRLPQVKNNTNYSIQVLGTGGQLYRSQMKGSAFIRALGTAVSTGTMSLPDVGDVQVMKVSATDPATGTTTTTTIRKGQKPQQPPGEPPAPAPQGAQP